MLMRVEKPGKKEKKDKAGTINYNKVMQELIEAQNDEKIAKLKVEALKLKLIPFLVEVGGSYEFEGRKFVKTQKRKYIYTKETQGIKKLYDAKCKYERENHVAEVEEGEMSVTVRKVGEEAEDD